jgi:hypothetical protein
MLSHGMDNYVPPDDRFPSATGRQDIDLERSSTYYDYKIVSQYDGLALLRLRNKENEYNITDDGWKTAPPNAWGFVA